MTARRPRLYLVGTAEPEPTINTTPLIDLMLVLIVMFIVSVPVATHQVPLDLPQGDPSIADPAPVHRVNVDSDGQVFWDGEPVGDPTLRARLAAVAASPAEPELHLAVDGEARYERVDEILATIRRAGVTRMGFVGNERFAASLG
jgi:biopolymer transport protein ExbD